MSAPMLSISSIEEEEITARPPSKVRVSLTKNAWMRPRNVSHSVLKIKINASLCHRKTDKYITVGGKRQKDHLSQAETLSAEMSQPSSYKIFCERIIRHRIIVNQEVLTMTQLRRIFLNLVKKHEDLDASNYRQDKLKRRLARDFPQLVFHSPNKRISEMIFVETLFADKLIDRLPHPSGTETTERHLHREHEENQALAQPANILHQPANVFNVDEDDNQEQIEGVQAEQLDDDWDALEQEGITDRSHFLLAVYKSDDAKTYGIDAVLRPIVDELNCIEKDGITVNTRDFQEVMKFTVVQVVGDNLGLNAILGADLETDNPSKTGLKRDSVLNSLSFYHVTDNVAVDVMHDILEGQSHRVSLGAYGTPPPLLKSVPSFLRRVPCLPSGRKRRRHRGKRGGVAVQIKLTLAKNRERNCIARLDFTVVV
ncbi:unnamed protein product [Leuciscus chuanchicus]